MIVIDGEAMTVTAKAARVYTVTRPSLGTTAAAHSPGAVVNVLKYKTIALFGMQCVIDAVTNIMNNPSFSYPTATTQNAVITTAQAAKNAAIAGAVQ